MIEIPQFKIYRVWNNQTKKWYRSNNTATFGNIGSIKNSLRDKLFFKRVNIEDYYLVVITNNESFNMPLSKIYE